MESFATIDQTRPDQTRPDQLLLSLVMPSIPDHIDTLLANLNIDFDYLPIKNIYVIGPDAIKERITQQNDSRLIFMNENEFVDTARIRELYSLRTDKNLKRAGWYIQQFIKIQFSRFTNDEYYLIWDSDTIPLKQIKMFSEDSRPFFDMKTEFHPPYFDTISKLFPDVKKVINKSFISEHMIINSNFMRALINEIENNTNLQGKNFQVKIINAIDCENLPHSGFSEFETYGNYVMTRYPESYILRDWHSLRNDKKFYRNASELTTRQIKWLSSYYDAISIEKWHKEYIFLAFIVQSKLFQKKFSAQSLENAENLPVIKFLLWLRGLPNRLFHEKIKIFIKRILRRSV